METYMKEKADIATHILQEDWDEVHEKSLELSKKEPENIEFIILVTAASAYGGFFQDTVDYGKKALIWAQDNGKDIKEYNSMGLSVIDIQEFIAQAYFGLEDFSAAADELGKIREIYGRLPDSIKQFAVKNENMLNGADAALDLAAQLVADFENRESESFLAFKFFETQICLHEVYTITEGADSLIHLPGIQAQKVAKYILRMVDCFEGFQENQLNGDRKETFELSKRWLSEISFALYTGRKPNGQPEIESPDYMAAEQCIMVLEKLSDLGKGFAQYLLGNIYAGAFNVEQDNVKAFRYYKAAYENGENEALVNLAFYYDEGIVIEKDTEKALEYAKKAAELGHEKAYVLLGKIYAESLGDVEQGIVWLRKSYLLGDEMAKNILLRLERENVDNFDDKLQFILDTNKKLETDIDALGTGYVSELGKKYARNYMEIEKYYVSPMERWTFMNVCLNVQVDLVTAPGGIVSGDYFIEQFEKLIEEDREMVSRLAERRQIASRISNLAFTETMDNIAAGNADINGLNWHKIEEYYFPKALELGWDGYYADGSGPWKPDSSGKTSKSVTSENQSKGTGFAAMDSYNSIPPSKSSSGGCYIATAVYGSYDCPEVWTFRRFRDSSLLKSSYGRAFIKCYYAISPALVKKFGNTGWFRNFWKKKLDKLAAYLKDRGYSDSPYDD